MRRSRFVRLAAAICLLALVFHGSVRALLTNGGFEAGDLSGWTESYFLNYGLQGSQPFSESSIVRTPGGSDRTTAQGGGAVTPLSLSDPVVGAGVQYPRFGQYAARVNYQGSGRSANSLRQQAVVDASDVDGYDNLVHIRFAYLPVVQDGGHTPSQQAYFFVILRNVTRGTVLYQRFTYANEAGVPWQSANGYLFTDWQVVDVAPGNAALAVGDTVEVEVIAAGCSLSGHASWVYVDAFGSAIPGMTIVGTAPTHVFGGTTLSYRFHMVNGGSAPLDNTVARITVPAQTTFDSVSDAACGHAGGVVTCNFGSVAAGATIDFDLVVTVNANASGTIALGTYEVEGTGYPALLGPVVNTAVHAAPVAVANSYSVAEDGTLTQAAPGVLGNDTDANYDALTAALVTGPAHGSLTLNPNGSFTYTPEANYAGADSFTYRASDGVLFSNTATVSLTITAVNDAPVGAGDSFAVDEDGILTIAAPGVLANDSDIEGTALSALLVAPPSHGVLALNANGSFVYTPAANYSGADSFTYRASDGSLQSGVVAVTLSVNAVNDAPTATGESYNGTEDVVLVVPAPGLLANDADVDGPSLTAVLASAPAHGTVTIAPDGGFTYTPAADYNGVDSFTYTAFDGTLASAPVSVTITLEPVDDTTWYPRAGRAPGGVRVMIRGIGFGPAGTPVTVTIGGVPGLSAEVLDPTTITFVTPALPPNDPVDIVYNVAGYIQQTLPGAYTPLPEATPTSPTDTDGDGLPDAWEEKYGLDPSDPSDAAADTDGDGIPNGSEYLAGSHPVGSYVRYFAEGLNHPNVRTVLALANASRATTQVRLTFFRQGAAAIAHELALQPQTRATLDTATIAGLASAAFGIKLEANESVVADRTMTWNQGGGEGSHTERAVEASASWYFAEGATTGHFSLFYLLTNPQAVPATVTLRYLPQVGAPLEQAYVVPPFARVTVPVNTAAPELASADLGAVVTADQPIVVERSMYLNSPTQTWVAGTTGTGVPAPATTWYFAEGAAGPFFDAWILLSNPGATDAAVDVRYVADSGADVTRSHAVPAGKRITIRVVDESPSLDGASFGTTVTSTNGVPVVAERAMWWQADQATWTEGHVGVGLSQAGTLWAAAEGLAASDGSADTFLLISNTGGQAGALEVTALFEDGRAPVVRTLPIAAFGRVTVRTRDHFPEAVGTPFSLVVESVGPTPAPIVVDHSIYWNAGGVLWGAGTSAPATRIR